MVVSMKPIAFLIVACSASVAIPAYAGASCEANSGVATAALVELYTSEGCSSCPPADKQLSQLKRQVGAAAVIVPLALHVSYWDAIGWKDPYAQKSFDQRQSQLLANRKNRIVYTPQFFVNGNELRAWRTDLPGTIKDINSKAAPLGISLKTMSTDDNQFVITADVKPYAKPVSGALYVALSESALVSHVLRGENSGVTLQHDDTVRAWFGPIPLQQGGAHLQQRITLPLEWKRQHLQAVAFVQDDASGNVLQAVSTTQCNQIRG